MGEKCRQCGCEFFPDWDEYGPETEWCEDCEEIMMLRSQKRAEWNAYHDEQCPEVELPQLPEKEPTP